MDSQHRFTDFELRQIYGDIASQFIEQNVDVIFRAHPSQSDIPDSTLIQNPHEVDLGTAISEAAAVCAINSTAGCDAIRLGAPLICHPAAYYAEYSSNTIDRVLEGAIQTRHLPFDVRQEFCAKIAYAQWTLDEMQNGVPHKFLLKDIDYANSIIE